VKPENLLAFDFINWMEQ